VVAVLPFVLRARQIPAQPLFRVAVVALACWVTGCLVDEPRVDPLEVVESVPADGEAFPAGAPILVRFDRYLDPRSVDGAAASLSSSDVSVGVVVGYSPVDRAIVLEPLLDLRPGLGYRVEVSADRVRAWDGGALEADFGLDFVAEPAGAARPTVPRVDFDTEIAPVFSARCGCHGPSPPAGTTRAWPTLTEGGLVGVESQGLPGVDLVEPGAPMASVLVLRLLPDHPGGLGPAKPPEGPLPDGTLRTIVSWVQELDDPR
jgi:hypothetical protein